MDEVEGSAAARNLTELIERLEASDGPDRECDAEIGRAYVASCGYPTDKGLYAPWKDKRGWNWQGYNLLPQFTASLDAALTLVPEGYKVADICEMFNKPGLDWMCVLLPRVIEDDEGPHPSGRHRLAPIALCIAALKARSAQVRTAAPKSTLGE